jgi:hypothetical protein
MGRTRPHLGALLRRFCVQERGAIWLGYAATSAPGPRASRPALPTRPCARLGVCGSVPNAVRLCCNHVPVARQASVGSSEVVLCCADRCSAGCGRGGEPSGCGRPLVSSAAWVRDSAAGCAAVAVTAAARASRSLCRWLVFLLRRLLWLFCLLAVLWCVVGSLVCLFAPLPVCEARQGVRESSAIRCTLGDATVPAGCRRARPHARQGDIRVHGNPAPLAAFRPSLLGAK